MSYANCFLETSTCFKHKLIVWPVTACVIVTKADFSWRVTLEVVCKFVMYMQGNHFYYQYNKDSDLFQMWHIFVRIFQ
jgi:hypothetical protein